MKPQCPTLAFVGPYCSRYSPGILSLSAISVIGRGIAACAISMSDGTGVLISSFKGTPAVFVAVSMALQPERGPLLRKFIASPPKVVPKRTDRTVLSRNACATCFAMQRVECLLPHSLVKPMLLGGSLPVGHWKTAVWRTRVQQGEDVYRNHQPGHLCRFGISRNNAFRTLELLYGVDK
jgi:hypothetical protein